MGARTLGLALAVAALAALAVLRAQGEGGKDTRDVAARAAPPGSPGPRLRGLERPLGDAPVAAPLAAGAQDEPGPDVVDDGVTLAFDPPAGFTAVALEARVAASDDPLSIREWGLLAWGGYGVPQGRAVRAFAKPGAALYVEVVERVAGGAPVRLLTRLVMTPVTDPVPERIVFRLPSLDDPRLTAVGLLPVLAPDRTQAAAVPALRSARWEPPARRPDHDAVLAGEDGVLRVDADALRGLVPEGGWAWKVLVEGVVLPGHEPDEVLADPLPLEALEDVLRGVPLRVRMRVRAPATARGTLRLVVPPGQADLRVRAQAGRGPLRATAEGLLAVEFETESRSVEIFTPQGQVWDVVEIVPSPASEPAAPPRPVVLPEMAEVTLEFVPYAGWKDEEGGGDVTLTLAGRKVPAEGDPLTRTEPPEAFGESGAFLEETRIEAQRPAWRVRVPRLRWLQLVTMVPAAASYRKGLPAICDFSVRPGETHLRLRWPTLELLEPFESDEPLQPDER